MWNEFVQPEQDTLVLIPQGNIGEFDYGAFENVSEEAIEALKRREARHVIVDLGHTDYIGSEALGLFLRLDKLVRQNDGQLVLCNISEHEIEVLRASNLDRFWTICPSRKHAAQLTRPLDTVIRNKSGIEDAGTS